MGVISAYQGSVTLVNRTDRPLNVRYDGEDTVLKPGENPGFPKVAVPYAKNQNILKGSRHPHNPAKAVFLVGVKGTKDDCSPLSDEILAEADKKYEAVDRSGEWHGEPMRKVQLLKKSGYSPYEAAVSIPGNLDVNPNIQ